MTQLNIKKYFLFFLFLCLASGITAQTRTASVSGNWSSTTTWGGQSVPTSLNDVVINNGINVTVTVNAAAASISFVAGTTATTLTVNSGITLDVSGEMVINTLSSANTTRTVTGAGTINCGSINIGGITNMNPNGTRITTLTSTISSFNVSGNITFQGWRWNSSTRISVPTLNVNSGTFTIDGQVEAIHEDAVNDADFNLGTSSPTLVLTNADPFLTPALGTLSTTFTGTGATVNYGGAAQTIHTTTYTNLTTSGTNTKTLEGATTVNGALNVGANTTLDLSTFTLGTPTSMVLSAGAVAGAAITGTGTLTLGGNVTVNDAGTGVSGAAISCPVALGATRTFTVANDGTTALDLTLSGIISGTGFGITKLGAGTMELSAANTYTGATTITAGILRASTNNVVASTNGPFGNAASSLLLNGGTLQTNVATFSRPLTVQATNSVIDAYGSARTISSTITLNTVGTFDLNIGATTVTNEEGQDLTLSGVIANTLGTLRIIKTGSSTATLSNTNTYSGSTTINSGTLNISANANLGTAPIVATAGHLTISNAATLATTGTFTLSTTRGIALGTSGGQIEVVSGTLSYGGIVAGSGNSLTKTGAGTLTLSGTNTFTGGFFLNEGGVNINNSQALGTVAGTFTIAGGTINNTSAGAITTLNYPISMNGDFTFTGTQALNLGTGAVTMNASRQISVAANTLTIGGVINHGALDLTKSGNGTLSFGSQSVSINNLTISGGALTSTSGTLSIAGNFSNSGTFTHNSGTVNYNNAAGGQTIAPVTYRNLTLSNTSGTNTAGGNITVGLGFTMSNANAILDMVGFDLTLGGSITLGGTIRTQSTSSTPVPTGLSWGGTIEYNNATGSQTIVAGTYTNLINNNTSGTNTAAGAVTVNGQLTVAAGGILDMSTFALSGTPTSAIGTGTIRTQNSATGLPVGITWLPTVEYYRAGNQTIASGTYATLITSGSGVKTLGGNTTVTTALTLTAGTLAVSTRTLTIQTTSVTNPAGVLSMSASGTLTFDFAGTLTFASAIFSGPLGTVNINGGGKVNLPSTPGSPLSIVNLNLNSGKLGLGAGSTLAIGGTVSNMSATNCLVSEGTASVEIGGTGALGTLYFDQTTPGTTNTISNFTINRNNLTGTLSIGNTVRVKTQLTPTAGTVTSNGNVVIGSDANGTGRIYPAINAANFAFVGDVKVERYSKSKNQRRFLFLSSPVDNISIRNAWQDDIFITGVGTGGTPCGAGTGNGGVTDKYNSNGFDATIANVVSIYRYDQNDAARWVAVPNTSYALEKGKGYRVLYRGARGVNDANCVDYLTQNNPPAPSDGTLNVAGTLIAGSFNVNVDGPTTGTYGYTLLGNPYVGELDFGLFASQNSTVIAPTYWTYDPNGTTNNTAYLSYTTNPPEVAGIYHSDPGGDPTNYTNPHLIGSGQAFFVQAGTDGQVTFSETQKSNQTQTGLFKTQTLNTKIRIHFRQADNTPIDNIVVRFSADPAVTLAENKNWDAITFNSGTYIASIKGTRSFAIQTRPLNFFNDTVQLRIVSASTGNFKLVFTQFAAFTEAAQIILIDQFTGTQTDVKANPDYPFTITSNSASQAGRFKLVFRSMSSVLPLSYLDIAAIKKTQGVEVSWKLAFEQGVLRYQVERSENGIDFKTTGSVESKGNSNVPVSYAFIDPAAANGTVYYRVKSVENGAGKYSPIVKLNATIHQPGLSLYPNPAKDRVTITSHTSEKATIIIRNAQGKTVMQVADVSFNNYSIDLSGFSSGLYIVAVHYKSGTVLTGKFIRY